MTLSAVERELHRNCGDELAACQAVGVSLTFLNQWRKDDKEVNERITEAGRVGTQGLVSAAIKRAVHGVQKGVYYKGALVSHETEYSDGLLQTLLKAKVPEFAKDSEHGNVNVQVNVANLMPRADSYAQWLEMKNKTLALPSATTDAEFVEVQPVPEFAGIEL